MKKIVKIDMTVIPDAGKRQMYVYRIASFSVDKVSLEKHFISLLSTLEGGAVIHAELNDETKVGTVTHRVSPDLVPILVKGVDEVLFQFESNEKMIISIDFKGIRSVIQ